MDADPGAVARTGSLLVPFTYSSVLWTGLIGALVFDTWPDTATWIGATILVASGCYIWHRERVSRARPPPLSWWPTGAAR